MFGEKKEIKPIALPEGTILGNFQLAAQLGEQAGKTMTISGYIVSGEDPLTLNARLDQYMAVMDRQRKRAEVPMLEAKLEQMKQALRQQQEIYEDMDGRAKKNQLMTSAEKKNYHEVLPNNMRNLREQIKKGEQAIEDAKKAGGLIGDPPARRVA